MTKKKSDKDHEQEAQAVEAEAVEPDTVDTVEEPDEPEPVEPEVILDPEEVLTRERDDYKDKWLRAVAEQDNVRKRARREVVDARRFAVADVLRDLLDVLDNFERATASVTDEGDDGANLKSIRSGLEMIHNRFKEILSARGVEAVPAETGQEFDPNIHEAVMRMESEDVESGAIVEVAQTGYKLNDLVLRPARVVVAQ
ncbi:nucleotide exchange factor GrpE [bacterium]|nr:nucleotide exchange factor GrpE [bacterium]